MTMRWEGSGGRHCTEGCLRLRTDLTKTSVFKHANFSTRKFTYNMCGAGKECATQSVGSNMLDTMYSGGSRIGAGCGRHF